MKAKAVILFALIVAGFFLITNISSKQKEQNVWQGYVESENILVAPLESSRITQLFVKRGDTVTAGQTLFTMEDDEARAALLQAQARMAQSEAQLQNLLTGKRPEEIAVNRTAIDDAEAGVRLARENYNRQKDLFDGGFVSARAVDSVKSAYDQALAKLAQAKKSLTVAALPARAQEIEAAMQARTAAQADVDMSQIRLDHRTIKAPASGLVEDVIRYAGEMAGPQQAVVSLLPPDARIIRFFVPETQVARFAVGKNVAISCDGCAQGLQANIRFISPKAEYTPPVIYSVQSRKKLVFMIETKPANTPLHTGQPVDIRILP